MVCSQSKKKKKDYPQCKTVKKATVKQFIVFEKQSWQFRHIKEKDAVEKHDHLYSEGT